MADPGPDRRACAARPALALPGRAIADRTLDGFTASELRKLRSFKEPIGIQRYIDAMPYHLATSAWSPQRVLHAQTAHCLEGAIFGAAALRALGHPPLIVDLEAERDTDHVIAVFKVRGAWGAIAKSNYAGLEYREPVYRTIRELAMSYFDAYFSLDKRLTLRTFSRPVDLKRFDRRGWMTSPKDVWYIPEYLLDISHTKLLTPFQRKQLHRVRPRSYAADLVGHRWGSEHKSRYDG